MLKYSVSMKLEDNFSSFHFPLKITTKIIILVSLKQKQKNFDNFGLSEFDDQKLYILRGSHTHTHTQTEVSGLNYFRLLSILPFKCLETCKV